MVSPQGRSGGAWPSSASHSEISASKSATILDSRAIISSVVSLAWRPRPSPPAWCLAACRSDRRSRLVLGGAKAASQLRFPLSGPWVGDHFLLELRPRDTAGSPEHKRARRTCPRDPQGNLQSCSLCVLVAVVTSHGTATTPSCPDPWRASKGPRPIREGRLGSGPRIAELGRGAWVGQALQGREAARQRDEVAGTIGLAVWPEGRPASPTAWSKKGSAQSQWLTLK